MCRFLLIKSRKSVKPAKFLAKFAEMAESSKAHDGDWQGDGWGISWLSQSREWQMRKSIRPIWKEENSFHQIPESCWFLIHARSSTFSRHKGVLDYNQPFFNESFAFVFNGLIKGVSLPLPTEGRIGSQKIWTILSKLLEDLSPPQALSKLVDLINKHSKVVQALNIGLCDKKNIYAYCQYSSNPEYYNLSVLNTPSLKMISSTPLDGYDFSPAATDEIIHIN